MKNEVIKPIATALWLLTNTTLTFRQIANFCQMDELDVEALADGYEKAFLEPNDPIKPGQLTKEEIKRCEADPEANLRLDGLPIFGDTEIKERKTKFTPMSKRKDKVNGTLFLVQNYYTAPNYKLGVAQIKKLTGADKKTVESIIDGTYSNLDELTPKDPVSLGLCTQVMLNEALAKFSPEKQIVSLK
jgi:hypothetical protein